MSTPKHFATFDLGNGNKIHAYSNLNKDGIVEYNFVSDNGKRKVKITEPRYEIWGAQNWQAQLFDKETNELFDVSYDNDLTTIATEEDNNDINEHLDNKELNIVIQESTKSTNEKKDSNESTISSSDNTQVLTYSKALKINSNDKNMNKNVVKIDKNIVKDSDETNRNNLDKLKKFLANHIHKKNDFINDMIRVCDEKIKLIQNGKIDNIYINSFPVISDRLKNQEWIFLKFQHIINEWNEKLSKITNDEVKITIKKGSKYDAIYLHHSKIIIK